jgi:NAD(P)-dependent dehydrogenase (short-subunit alcohol dehydrogenase family)
LVGRRADVLEAAAHELGGGTTFESHDVTDTAAAPQLIERIVKHAGCPSILVNNAGIHLKKAAVDTTEAEFDAVMVTHVTAAFALSRATAQVMIPRGGGNLVFMASMASLMGIPKVVAYSAAKSAYIGLVRSLAVELAPEGIRVNAIAPGWIETPMLHKAMESDPRRKARVLERTPMGRLGHPEDIGWAAVYLCSPAAGFVNGVVLPVDGGAAIGF